MMFPVCRRIIHLYSGALRDVLRLTMGGKLIDGPHIGEFERAFAERVGVKHAVATATGRLALRLLLEAFERPRGGEVLIPAYEDTSVPETISNLGMTPVCVDIDPETQNISLDSVRERLTERTSAIVVAHIFGNPFDVPALREMVKDRDVIIIEDCAHAVGTTLGDRHVGSFGDAAIFSFHTTKPFMTFGGGMVVTDNDRAGRAVREHLENLPPPSGVKLLRRILSAFVTSVLAGRAGFALLVYPWLRLMNMLNVDFLDVYNRTGRKAIKIKQTATRYTNLQALVGLKNLRRLDEAVSRRREHIKKLDAVTANRVSKPRTAQGSNGYFYTIYCPQRDALRKKLLRVGIDTGKDLMRNCAVPLGQGDRCPSTARVIAESVQIPIHERLSGRTVDRMAEILDSVLGQDTPLPSR